ncbi:uncharacterized protein WM294_001698 [Sarcoramphus papa]
MSAIRYSGLGGRCLVMNPSGGVWIIPCPRIPDPAGIGAELAVPCGHHPCVLIVGQFLQNPLTHGNAINQTSVLGDGNAPSVLIGNPGRNCFPTKSLTEKPRPALASTARQDGTQDKQTQTLAVPSSPLPQELITRSQLGTDSDPSANSPGLHAPTPGLQAALGCSQDFLRSIPAKLLVSHLYEDWMQAMERTSKQAKVEELKAVAEKLPAANLLLLQRLLSLLQRIGHNASTSRMTSSNLAVCLGPNLLSPPNEDQLPLQAMLEVTAKVNVLVEFMIENRGDVFGEETPGLSCPSAQESPAPMAGSTDLRLEEQSGPAGRADKDHQATACLDASPSLLDLLKEAGGDTLLQSETAEAPRALPPTTPESAAEALVRPEQRTSLSEERR